MRFVNDSNFFIHLSQNGQNRSISDKNNKIIHRTKVRKSIVDFMILSQKHLPKYYQKQSNVTKYKGNVTILLLLRFYFSSFIKFVYVKLNNVLVVRNAVQLQIFMHKCS